MNSIYLFTYRMSGSGELSTLPVYASCLDIAKAAFHRRMGEFGCEGCKYQLLRHRLIPERAIHFTFSNHHKIIQRLSADDQLDFFTDRRARLVRERGHADPKTEQFFQQEQIA